MNGIVDGDDDDSIHCSHRGDDDYQRVILGDGELIDGDAVVDDDD